MLATFSHYDLRLYDPPFASPVTDLIIALEHLRKKKLEGTTHPQIFYQLKHIFQMMESIGSARIEGNRTTIAEYIETKINQSTIDENIREILNSEKAMEFIDENILDNPLDRAFISEIHKYVVDNLISEGSASPGRYRTGPIQIAGSKHLPPPPILIAGYMDELFSFIRTKHEDKYDLLKTAISHHRFAWIHPFDNGNGRTARLFTYAMLVKQGFNVHHGRIINPTAIFCSDRKKYYIALEKGDTGKRRGILNWCEYVLGGLKVEIEKIDKLLRYEYLETEILLPMLSLAKKNKYITEIEEKILKVAITKQVFVSADIESLHQGKAHTERSRSIKRLLERKLIETEKDSARKYVIRFSNNFLLRSIIEILAINGFLPLKE